MMQVTESSRDEKWALITGASSGIGYEYALQLGTTHAYNLVVVARREENLIRLKEKINAINGTNKNIQILIAVYDLSLNESRQRLFGWLDSQNIQIELLVNNAGMGYWKKFSDSSFLESNQMIDLNISCLTNMTTWFLNHTRKFRLQEKRNAKIINVGSIASYFRVDSYATYAASKHYVRAFSEILSFEEKKNNLQVQCLCPGGTQTEFIEKAGQNLKPMAKLFMMTAYDVVSFSLHKLEKAPKQLIVIPGWTNFIMTTLAHHLPLCMTYSLFSWMMRQGVEEKRP